MAKKISDVLIKIKGDSKDLDQSLSQSKSSLRSFAASAATRLAQVGVALGAVAAAAAAYSVKQAMTFSQLERGFDSLAESQGTNADKFLADLRKMSHGTVSAADIMQRANQAMLLGIDTKTITQMMEGASVIAQATGQDVGYMFESLALGVGRQSRMLLDNLGIIVKVEEAEEAYAKSIGVAVNELTDEQKKTAFLNATMDGLNNRVNALGGFTMDTKAKWDLLKASLADSAVELGQVLMPELDKVLSWFVENADWMKTTFSEIFDIEVAGFGDMIVEQLDRVKAWIDRNKEDMKWWVDVFKEAGALVQKYPELTKAGRATMTGAAPAYGAEKTTEITNKLLPKMPSLNIQMDAAAVEKFLSGQVVAVTGFSTISGT